MRWSIILFLALAACSRAEGPSTGDGRSTAQERSGADVAPTLVPGIALSYGYSFLLPVRQVASTLERHAARCEALGTARCRITGMTYHAVPGRSVSAGLEMKLAPAIARAFGREATAAVAQDGGMLTDSEITSVEAGATIERAKAAAAQAQDERADLRRQLDQPGLPAAERAQLQARVAALDDTAATQRATVQDAGALLAATPMRFSYESGVVDASFDDGPIRRAFRDGERNMIEGTALIVALVIALLPWALAGVALLLAYRLVAARLRRWTTRPD